jgi:hypothetical protein
VGVVGLLRRVTVMKSKLSAALVAACVLSLSAATGTKANTITQTLTVSGFSTTGTETSQPTNSFSEFDTAFGTLNNIQVSLSGSATWSGSSQTPVLSLNITFAGTGETVVPGNSFHSFGTISVNLSGTDSFAPDFAFVEGTGTTTLDFRVDQTGG